MVTRGKTIFGKIIKNVSPYLTKSGARQVGKSYIVRHVASEAFEN